jgi:hypothetical protein
MAIRVSKNEPPAPPPTFAIEGLSQEEFNLIIAALNEERIRVGGPVGIKMEDLYNDILHAVG